jgi:hypothetical protein
MLNLNYLTTAFLKQYRKRLHTSLDINYGDCFRWAMLAYKLYGGQLISVTLMVENSWEGYPGQLVSDGSHAFIKLDDKYYDSESPEGVNDWQELKYFSRLDVSMYDNWEYEVRWHPSIRSFQRFWYTTSNISKADQKLYRKLRTTI